MYTIMRSFDVKNKVLFLLWAVISRLMGRSAKIKFQFKEFANKLLWNKEKPSVFFKLK